MSPKAKSQLKRSGLWALAAACFLSLPHGGFLAIYIVIWLCIRLPIAIYRARKKPDQEAVPWVIASVWSTAIILVVGIHLVGHKVVRGEDDKLVAAIEQFHQSNGRYPDALTEFGFNEETIQSRIGLH
jgi:hypothetical protein